ncbi:DUF2905 domain-containing protein [Bacillaceae bacterium Marseille-Q3522]|nr:DUF2905 domain-containing protein [Bacillaceae bacterium Marseille-Q3522]
MNSLAKIVMVAGIVIFAVGFLMQFFSLGRLPGDIVIKRENSTFYFPITTSILLSIALSLILYLIGKFK